MSGLLRTVVTVAWPHGGQRQARENALAALQEARAAAAEQSAALAAFEPAQPAPLAVNR